MAIDRSHNLGALSVRDGHKPYEKLKNGDAYASERTIFRDTGTHAEVWKLTHDPAISRHIYYDIPAWNADGSALFFVSRRPGKHGGNWFMDADGGRIRELYIRGEEGRVPRPLWSGLKPDVMYYSANRGSRTAFCSVNVKTGERRELASVDLQHNVEFCPPSSDEKKLLVRGRKDPEQKVWTVYLIDIQSGKQREVPIEGNIHRLRFTRGADYSIFYNLNDPIKEVRLGSYIIQADGTGKTELPCGQAGHPDWAHDGHAWSYASESGIWVMDKDGTNRRQVVNLAGGMHGGWSFDNEWIVSDVTARGPYANQILLIHTEERGRIHRICHHNSSYQGWGAMHPDAESTHPAPIVSPDGTKVVFDSDMVGLWGEVYVAVLRRPDPPVGLQAEGREGRVRLTWKRPARSKELKGYYVYRSRESGEGFEQVSEGIVTGDTFEDRTHGQGTAFYRVTMVEYSGLEGRSSAEVRMGSEPGEEPVRLFIEPELGRREGLTDQFDGRASNLYFVALKDSEQSGRVHMDVDLPRSGSYGLWARVAGKLDRILGFTVCCNDREVGRCEAVVDAWGWVRVLDARGRPVVLNLDGGAHVLTAATSNRGVKLDQLLLTDDTAYIPSEKGGEDATPPAQVTGVEVETGDVSELQVTWAPVSDPDFHHYNVYASTDPNFVCDQRTLIASPSEIGWIDWGLPSATPYWCSTTYYYRVTAVDRAGNESVPSEMAWGRTGIHSWRSLQAMGKA